MDERQEHYERPPGFPGGMASLLSFGRIYLGSGHLLLVRRNLFTESYKRLYLADIQAISVRKTLSGRVLNAVLGALGVTCAVSMAWLLQESSNQGDSVAMFAVLFVVAPCLVLVGALLIANIVLGPTCVCHARTAVQVVKLPSLGRLRAAQRAAGALRELVEGAQGAVAADEVNARALPALRALEPEGKPITHETGRFHQALCHVLLVDVVLCLLDMVDIETSRLSQLCLLASVALAAGALIRQRNSDLGRGLKLIPWITVIYVSILWMSGVGVFMAFILDDPDVFTGAAPNEGPVFVVMSLIEIGMDLSLGLAGLLLLRDRRKRVPRSPATGTGPTQIQAIPDSSPPPSPEWEERED